MCRRGTRGKAGQEGKGSRTSTTHIELDYALESESSRISAISACREMSSGRYTRRKCSEVTGKRHYKKNIELDKNRAYLPFEQARGLMACNGVSL
jgi:hypothetical protein